jgi:coatomer subunit beta'
MSGVFSLAEECFLKSKDFNSLFLYYSTYGDEEGLKTVSQMAEDEGKLNVAFQASFVVADIERCLNLLIKGKRFADASMFSRAYCPSKANDILETWGKQLKG